MNLQNKYENINILLIWFHNNYFMKIENKSELTFYGQICIFQFQIIFNLNKFSKKYDRTVNMNFFHFLMDLLYLIFY